MRQANFLIITNGDMSLASIPSSPVSIDQKWGGSIIASYTGAPVGTIKVQVSNDMGVVNPDGTVTGLNVWADLPGAATSITAAGSYPADISLTAYSWIRVVYTKTSGTGVLNVRANVKG